MTFSVRITAALGLLALLAGYGSVRAEQGEGEGWSTNPRWVTSPFASEDYFGNHPVAGPPRRISRSRTAGQSTHGWTPTLPLRTSLGAKGDSFFGRWRRPDSYPVDCMPPIWTVTADALLLWRSPARSQAVLFAPALNPPDVLLLDMGDVEFSAQSGPRLGLTRHLVNDFFVEFNYFGIDGWSAGAERDGNPLALFPPGILVSSHFTVDYGSDLHSAEVNLRRRCFGRLELLAGARWVQLREEFHVFGPNPLSGALPDVRYDTLVDNSMYGFQIGASGKFFDRCGPLSVDGFVKAGIYGNRGTQETSTLANLGTQATVAADGEQVSMLGEAGFTVLYCLGKHLTARVGYQVMWIEGVALAPDQISTTNVLSTPATATLGADGSLFYHGYHVGLEGRW